jgi:hypothetical protein
MGPTVKYLFAVATALLLIAGAGCERVVQTKLLDTHAEFRSSRPPWSPYPLFAAGLHIRNDDTVDLQSIRIDYQFAKHEPWRGPSSFPPPGWKPKLEYATQKCYINMRVKPGGEAFLVIDESYLVVEFKILSIEARTSTFHPPKSQEWDWHQMDALPDISPKQLREYLVRKDPPHGYTLPIDREYKWDTLPIVGGK